MRFSALNIVRDYYNHSLYGVVRFGMEGEIVLSPDALGKILRIVHEEFPDTESFAIREALRLLPLPGDESGYETSLAIPRTLGAE